MAFCPAGGSDLLDNRIVVRSEPGRVGNQEDDALRPHQAVSRTHDFAHPLSRCSARNERMSKAGCRGELNKPQKSSEGQFE